MKKFLSIYANWRNDVLIIVFALSVFALFGEPVNLVTLVLSKALAIAGFCVFGMLFQYWNKLGKINELSSLAKEED